MNKTERADRIAEIRRQNKVLARRARIVRTIALGVAVVSIVLIATGVIQ